MGKGKRNRAKNAGLSREHIAQRDRVRAATEHYNERAQRAVSAVLDAGSAGHYRYTETFAPPTQRVDVDGPTLGQSPEQQYAEFFTREGDFYHAVITVPIPEPPTTPAPELTGEFMVKATAEDLPLVLEVLRQVRGALGGRVELTKAAPAPEPTAPVPSAETVLARQAAERLATERNRLAEQMTPDIADVDHAAAQAIRNRAAQQIQQPLPTIDDGPPYQLGTDIVLGERVPPYPPGTPWAEAQEADARQAAVRAIATNAYDQALALTEDLSLDELRRMLPGRTRHEVAVELGVEPETLGPDPTKPNPEQMAQIAKDQGVDVSRVRPVPIRGGGYAYSIDPPAPEPLGRHAAPEHPDEQWRANGAR